jgi:death-on-curing protein
VTVHYLDLTDYLAIAAEVTGLSSDILSRITKLNLADSALHAPAAGFGKDDFYPDLIDKAAVLLVRLTNNHPLPNGNKRTAWLALRLFIEANRWKWAPYPSVDEAEAAMIAIAAGEWREDEVAEWLRPRLLPPSSTTDT